MTAIKTVTVETHTCRECGHIVASSSVPELCPNCGEIVAWSTVGVAVAVGVSPRNTSDLASGRSGQVMM